MTKPKIEQTALSERIINALRYYFPTIMVAVSVLLLWEFLVVIFDIQQFLLPKPSVIGSKFMAEVDLLLNPDTSSLLFDATGATFYEALGGFIIGCGSGIFNRIDYGTLGSHHRSNHAFCHCC